MTSPWLPSLVPQAFIFIVIISHPSFVVSSEHPHPQVQHLYTDSSETHPRSSKDKPKSFHEHQDELLFQEKRPPDSFPTTATGRQVNGVEDVQFPPFAPATGGGGAEEAEKGQGGQAGNQAKKGFPQEPAKKAEQEKEEPANHVSGESWIRGVLLLGEMKDPTSHIRRSKVSTSRSRTLVDNIVKSDILDPGKETNAAKRRLDNSLFFQSDLIVSTIRIPGHKNDWRQPETLFSQTLLSRKYSPPPQNNEELLRRKRRRALAGKGKQFRKMAGKGKQFRKMAGKGEQFRKRRRRALAGKGKQFRKSRRRALAGKGKQFRKMAGKGKQFRKRRRRALPGKRKSRVRRSTSKFTGLVVGASSNSVLEESVRKLEASVYEDIWKLQSKVTKQYSGGKSETFASLLGSFPAQVKVNYHGTPAEAALRSSVQLSIPDVTVLPTLLTLTCIVEAVLYGRTEIPQTDGMEAAVEALEEFHTHNFKRGNSILGMWPESLSKDGNLWVVYPENLVKAKASETSRLATLDALVKSCPKCTTAKAGQQNIGKMPVCEAYFDTNLSKSIFNVATPLDFMTSFTNLALGALFHAVRQPKGGTGENETVFKTELEIWEHTNTDFAVLLSKLKDMVITFEPSQQAATGSSSTPDTQKRSDRPRSKNMGDVEKNDNRPEPPASGQSDGEKSVTRGKLIPTTATEGNPSSFSNGGTHPSRVDSDGSSKGQVTTENTTGIVDDANIVSGIAHDAESVIGIADGTENITGVVDGPESVSGIIDDTGSIALSQTIETTNSTNGPVGNSNDSVHIFEDDVLTLDLNGVDVSFNEMLDIDLNVTTENGTSSTFGNFTNEDGTFSTSNNLTTENETSSTSGFAERARNEEETSTGFETKEDESPSANASTPATTSTPTPSNTATESSIATTTSINTPSLAPPPPAGTTTTERTTQEPTPTPTSSPSSSASSPASSPPAAPTTTETPSPAPEKNDTSPTNTSTTPPPQPPSPTATEAPAETPENPHHNQVLDSVSYYSVRQFLDDAQSSGKESVHLIPLWISDHAPPIQPIGDKSQFQAPTNEEGRKEKRLISDLIHNKRPFKRYNFVDLTTTTTTLHALVITSMAGMVDIRQDLHLQEIVRSSFRLLTWFTDHPDDLRTAVVLSPFPSRFQLYWLAGRIAFLLTSSQATNPGIFQFAKDVIDAFLVSLRTKMTLSILESIVDDGLGPDGKTRVYVDDILGVDDLDDNGKSKVTGDDRLFTSAMSVNALISTWTTQQPDGQLKFISGTKDSVRIAVNSLVNYISSGIQNKNLRQDNVLMASLVKDCESLPAWYPYTIRTSANGKPEGPSEVTVHDRFGVTRYIPKDEYQRLLSKPQSGVKVPENYSKMYLRGSDSLFYFWSSEAYTKAACALAIAQAANLDVRK